MLHLEHRFPWCGKSDISENTEEIPVKCGAGKEIGRPVGPIV
jgi:hypothetical protein